MVKKAKKSKKSKSKSKSAKKSKKLVKKKKKISKKTAKKSKKKAQKKVTKVKKATKVVKKKTKAKAVKPKTKIMKKVAEGGKHVEVVNIVVSTSLEHDIPLEKMAATLPNTEYNPEQFPGLVIRIKEPKTSALIFSSGKVVCTGARSMDKVHDAIKKIIKSLEKINIKIKIEPKVNIQNIVASGSVGMDLNLNVLAMKLDNTEYEPEQFPGLVYKLPEAKATFLLFSNGKIVCTGTKTEDEVHAAVEKLIKNLKKVLSR